MRATKISLSPEEIRFISDASVILTKNAIIEKTKTLLNELQDRQEQYVIAQPEYEFPAIANSSPKISRGENYMGLPYLVLDYPRIFEKDNTVAIRTMFWWGNFFSITLHLSGKYKTGYENDILHAYTALKETGFYCCINESEWEHHFQPGNYRPMKKMSYNDFEKLIQERSFVKLAYKLPLDKWNEAVEILYDQFTVLIALMDQAPRR